MILSHEIHGDGPSAIVIHGITESRETWRPLVPQLARSRRVLLVDLRGHGASDLGDVYDPITLATDVHETFLSAGFPSSPAPLVIGHSLGGVVASAYAALFATRGVVNVDQPLRLAAFKGGLAQLEPMLRGDSASFEAAIAMVFGAMMGALSADEVARVNAGRRPAQSVVLGVWSSVLESSVEELDAQVAAIAGGITVPYLAVHGSDPGGGYGDWLCTSVPSAVYELWPDLGHYPHLVEPDRFVARVAEFDALT